MEKILIIDDDQVTLRLIQDILTKAGYATCLAADGELGIQLVETEKPDLVITDYLLPGINGLEVLSAIRKYNRRLPVILLTGYGDVALTIRSIQAGVFDYLEKPVDRVQLKTIVQIALSSVRTSQKLPEVPVGEIFAEDPLANIFMVAKTQAMKEIFKTVGRISMSKVNVLIQGETGTGKELTAKLIHHSGVNAADPMITVNCSALSEPLMQLELFGSLTETPNGRIERKGKLELAGNGTLLFNEIGDLSLSIQAKLLRAIQEQEFEQMGSSDLIPMKARIIATTRYDLESKVREGKFREDLYHRIRVFAIDLPPLRDRQEDMRDLVICFLHKLNHKFNRHVIKIGEGVIEHLQGHHWPGNVRELENTLLQAIVMSKNDVLETEQIALTLHPTKPVTSVSAQPFRSIAELERFHIKKILDEVKWNKLLASQILEITRPTLNAKIEKYQLRRN